MLNSILANVIAGLGLFFSGLRMVDANLRQTTGRELRTIIRRFTGHPGLAALVGIATGALVQSSSGIVFILVSLVTSGLTTVRRAMPIATWSNVGCCALIFIAALDLRLGILYLIGLAGVGYAFDRSHRSETLGAVFGVGMLFYGIELMRMGTEPLKGLPWFVEVLNSHHASLVLPLLSGAAFSFVTQSSTAVSILVIGLAQSGLLGPFPGMMALYGANVGSTFARMVLSSTLKGSARQLTASQDLFKITGAVLFVSLLYVEVVAKVPLVHALVAYLSSRPDRQLALVALLFNLTMAIVFTLAQSPIIHVLERWLPADANDDLARPQFLYQEALAEPATALDLIEKEQTRLLRSLPIYCAAMRTGAGSPERESALGVQAPFTAVAAATGRFQHDLVGQQLGPGEGERLARLQSRLSLIGYLEESLRTLTVATESVPAEGRLRGLVASFVEGLDFVMMTLIDATSSDDPDARALLATITEDRGDLVERIRRQYLTDEAGVGSAERGLLLQVTSTFERVVWMVQRLSRLIEVPQGPDAAPARGSAEVKPAGSVQNKRAMPDSGLH